MKRWPELHDGQRRAILISAVLLTSMVGIAAAAHIDGTLDTTGPAPIEAQDGMTGTLETSGTQQAWWEENFPTTGSIEFVTEQGNITFFSSGDANATVHVDEIEGTWTNVTAITADPNTITITPGDKDQSIVGQEIDTFAYRSGIAADDGTVDFSYTASANGRVTVQGVPADADLYAIDASTNNIIDQADSTGGGAVTFDGLDSGDRDILIQQDVNEPPTFSNPTPTGNVDSTFSSIEIDVNDTNFPQGDSVTAELFVDGSSQGTDTLTSNGTASVAFSPDLGETYTYYWNASDSYGGVTNGSVHTVSTPSNVTIREEHNASLIVTDANATITLYSDDATIVVEREDTNGDGNISLTGLPDKEFVAVLEADDHYQRRVYIESIYEQQNIFMLNSTEVPGGEAVNTTFVFEDRTGDFPPESSTLRVQRALDLNNDGTFEWMTVAGDFWGAASEFPFTGEEGARYRLIVENDEGDRRVLGTHIPTDDGVKNIINGEIRFEAGNATGRWFDANLSSDAGNIQVLYEDPTNSTGDLRVRVWELGNQSNEIHDQNYTSSPYGQLFTTIGITSDQAEQSWVIRIDGQTDDGEAIELQTTVGHGVGIALPVDPWLLAAFSVIGLTFVGSMYGPRTATIGSWVLVLAATGLTAFGWIGIPVIGLIAAAVIAAGGTFYSEALP